MTPADLCGHHCPMDRFRISPRPRNTGWTLASGALAFPLWYLEIDAAESYAKWYSRVNGAVVEIRDTGGTVTKTVEFTSTADNPY